MDTPCYNTQCLNRYLREQDEQYALDIAAENLSAEMYEEIEAIAKQHPLLIIFLEQQDEALNDFLMDEALEQLSDHDRD